MRWLVLIMLGCTKADDTDSPLPDDTQADTADTFDTGVSQLMIGDLCDPEADACPEGSACCTACCRPDEEPRCAELDESGECPLPDITVDQVRLQSSWIIENRFFEEGDCAYEESCIDAPGDRTLLRFDTKTPNIGTAALHFGSPYNTEAFEYSECHDHMHFVGYASYDLVDSLGNTAATGHKQAFCLMNFEEYDPEAPNVHYYNCGFQGIDVGWADTYYRGLDCQWIDITDVAPGEYTLQVSVNYLEAFPEISFENNFAQAQVIIPEASEAVLQPCGEGAPFGPERDCGWALEGNIECEAGQTVDLGCADCIGDPIMRVCSGADNACVEEEALANVDDYDGSDCPQASVVCPAEGSLTILVGTSFADGDSTCDVSAEVVEDPEDTNSPEDTNDTN